MSGKNPIECYWVLPKTKPWKSIPKHNWGLLSATECYWVPWMQNDDIPRKKVMEWSLQRKFQKKFQHILGFEALFSQNPIECSWVQPKTKPWKSMPNNWGLLSTLNAKQWHSQKISHGVVFAEKTPKEISTYIGFWGFVFFNQPEFNSGFFNALLVFFCIHHILDFQDAGSRPFRLILRPIFAVPVESVLNKIQHFQHFLCLLI